MHSTTSQAFFWKKIDYCNTTSQTFLAKKYQLSEITVYWQTLDAQGKIDLEEVKPACVLFKDICLDYL